MSCYYEDNIKTKYQNKYLKYKIKYNTLRNITYGASTNSRVNNDKTKYFSAKYNVNCCEKCMKGEKCYTKCMTLSKCLENNNSNNNCCVGYKLNGKCDSNCSCGVNCKCVIDGNCSFKYHSSFNYRKIGNQKPKCNCINECKCIPI
jgi:hypothetical protein